MNTKKSHPKSWKVNTTNKNILYNLGDVTVIKAIFQFSLLKKVNKSLNISAGSKISNYLQLRGLNIIEFRLIQYMAGASPNQANAIIEARRLKPLAQLTVRIAPFIVYVQPLIYEMYVSLFNRLSQPTNQNFIKAYFKKIRFIAALEFARDINEAANILEINLEELSQFVNSESQLSQYALKKMPADTTPCSPESYVDLFDDAVNGAVDDAVNGAVDDTINDECEKSIFKQFGFYSPESSSFPAFITLSQEENESEYCSKFK